MATNAQVAHPELTEEGVVLFVLELGHCQVRVIQKRYRERNLIDLRRWLPPVTPGEPARPTRKGISLSPLQWREILPAIAAALPVAPDEGEVEQDDEGDDE